MIARMDSVRERISQVRLVFIETIDKHTEIDQVKTGRSVKYENMLKLHFTESKIPGRPW